MYQGNTIKHKSSELNYLYRSSFPDHDQGVGIIVHLEIQGVAENRSPFFYLFSPFLKYFSRMNCLLYASIINQFPVNPG